MGLDILHAFGTVGDLYGHCIANAGVLAKVIKDAGIYGDFSGGIRFVAGRDRPAVYY